MFWTSNYRHKSTSIIERSQIQIQVEARLSKPDRTHRFNREPACSPVQIHQKIVHSKNRPEIGRTGVEPGKPMEIDGSFDWNGSK